MKRYRPKLFRTAIQSRKSAQIDREYREQVETAYSSLTYEKLKEFVDWLEARTKDTGDTDEHE
jgi:hypothetical protein